MNWYFSVLKKYAVFSGRARRKEYWMFILFNYLILFLLVLIDFILLLNTDLTMPILTVIYSISLVIPSLAVSIRRLHDTNHSGWWMFLNFAIFGYAVSEGTTGENRFGPDPKRPSLVDMKPCPFCYETIKARAIVCKHCGRDIDIAAVQKIDLENNFPTKIKPDSIERKNIFCYSCGDLNPINAVNCIGCGKILEKSNQGIIDQKKTTAARQDSNYCPSCGFWNSYHAVKCIGCGTSLEKPKQKSINPTNVTVGILSNNHCLSCGFWNPSHAVNCIGCGKSLE